MSSGLALAKNLLDRYVVRTYLADQDITIYHTKSVLLEKPLAVLEKKILAKFDTLLASETISREEYEKAVQAYSDFVLHLSIYRDYRQSTLVKEKTLSAIKIFSAVYAKKPTPGPEPSL